jgi:diadenosine tetraphosphate (Ap4A) HIT family hydrolase
MVVLRSTADFFFKLPFKERKAIMLEVAKEASAMQMKVIKKLKR